MTIQLTLQRNLSLKNAFKTVKSKIKNQNAKTQIKIQKVLSPREKTSRYAMIQEYGFSGEYGQLLTSLIFALYF